MGKRKAGNGEGTIYQRTRDGRWIAELTLGWRQDGKRKIVRKAFATRKKAADWLAEQQVDRQKGQLVEPSRLTVGEFLENWLKDVVTLSTKPSTVQNYTDMVRRNIRPQIGQIQLQKLSPLHVQRMYGELLRAGKSPRTVHLVHAVLRRALQQALEWSLVPRNVGDAVRRPRAEPKEMQVLSPDQVRRFIAESQSERLHALYTMAITCGLRLGELLGLRWRDVDIKNQRLTVKQILFKVGGKMEFGTPKTASSRRTVDLPAVVVTALNRWQKEQAEEGLAVELGRQQPDTLVFTTTIGSALNPSNIRNRSFYALLERAGCPKIRFHDLRHTAATLMLINGVQPRVLQDVLGHSDIRMTLGTYSHVLPEQKREAASAIDGFLAASPSR